MEFIYLQKGGKLNTKKIEEKKKDFNDKNWSKSETSTGNNSMNPKDWTTKGAPYGSKKYLKETKKIVDDAKKSIKPALKKNGGKVKTSKKKCECGCAMKITKNAKGGLIEVCSCGCGGKMKKKTKK